MSENTEQNASDATEQSAADSSASAQNDQNKTVPTLSFERGGIVGVKAGMTRIYTENGEALPVTVIDLPENVITQLKTNEKDGYQAVQVGVLDKKESKANRAEKGRLAKIGVKGKGFYHYQEFRFDSKTQFNGLANGQVLSAGFLKDGDTVDLTAVSKGKGFQGPMKRHNFGGGAASHGASLVHRSGGSIGNSAGGRGRVYKNTEMAGHMGHKKVTLQNVKVARVDADKGYLLVHGSVPGPKSGLVTIRKAIKA